MATTLEIWDEIKKEAPSQPSEKPSDASALWDEIKREAVPQFQDLTTFPRSETEARLGRPLTEAEISGPPGGAPPPISTLSGAQISPDDPDYFSLTNRMRRIRSSVMRGLLGGIGYGVEGAGVLLDIVNDRLRPLKQPVFLPGDPRLVTTGVDPKEVIEAGRGITQAAESAYGPQQIGFGHELVETGAQTALIAAAAPLGLPAGMAAGGLMAAGGAYEEAVANRWSDQDAKKYALWAAVIGTSEALPFASLWGRLSKVGKGNIALRVVKGALMQAGEEGAQEYAQTVGQNFAQRRIGNPEEDISDSAVEAVRDPNVWPQVKIGLALGGLFGAGGAILAPAPSAEAVARWGDGNPGKYRELARRVRDKAVLTRSDVEDVPGFQQSDADNRATLAETVRALEAPALEAGLEAIAGQRLGVDIAGEPQAVGVPAVEHVMPSGETMPGPEHPGAFPGSERPVRPLDPLTSTKRAWVEADRDVLGLDPLDPTAPRKREEAMEIAKERIAAYPNLPTELVVDLRENPRPISQRDGAVLLVHYTDLRRAYNGAADDVVATFDSGNDVAHAGAKERLETARKAIDDFHESIKRSRTETGRALDFFRALADQDYTLVSLERDLRAQQDGWPLDAKQEQTVQDIAKEHARLTQEKETHAFEAEEASVRQTATDLLGDIVKEVETEAPGKAKTAKLVDKILKRLDDSAAESHKRIVESGGTAYAIGGQIGLVPDLARVIASKMAHGIVDVARVTSDLVSAYGEWIRPHIAAAYEQAKSLVESETKKTAPSRRTRATIRAQMEAVQPEQRRQETLDRIRERFEEGDVGKIGPLVQNLARHYVDQGVRDLDALLDAMLPEVQSVIPDMTRRQLMDSFSGYGQYRLLSKDEIDVALRDLRGQAQQSAKIEDMMEGLPPKRTGAERRTPTKAERRLIRKVNEEKKRLGIQTADPETQLRTALETAETRLRNAMDDMWSEITSGEQAISGRAAPPDSPRLQALREIHQGVKQVYDTVFPKEPAPRRELTDEQRIQMTLRALERAAEAKREMLRRGDISPKPRKPKAPETPEVKAARAENEALQNTIELMRLIAKPDVDPDVAANRIYQARKLAQIAYMERRLRESDFSPRQPKPFKKDPKSLEIERELSKVRERYSREKFKAKLARRKPAERAFDIFRDATHTARSLLTSYDLSAIGRQGVFTLFSNPARTAKAFKPMWDAMWSDEKRRKIDQDIKERQNAPFYVRDGLSLADIDSYDLNRVEEEYMGRWINLIAESKVPVARQLFKGVEASNRAYTTFLNVIRADTYDALSATLTKTGTPSPEEGRAIARFVNMSTGRGSLGRFEHMTPALNIPFFAPRFVLSRFNLAVGAPVWIAPTKRTKKIIAKEYAKYALGMGIFYAMSEMAGFDVEWDWRSGAFGKIKIGNQTIDPLGGLSQTIAFMARTATGTTKTMTGRVRPLKATIDEPLRFGESNWSNVAGRFLRTKLSPPASFFVDWRTGENVMGEQIGLGENIARHLIPIAGQDVLESAQEYGLPRTSAMALVGLLGFSVQTIPEERMMQIENRQREVVKRTPASYSEWRSRRGPGADVSSSEYQRYRQRALAERKAARAFLEARKRD